MSHQGGHSSDKPKRKKVTVQTLRVKKRKGKPLTMLTAYDFATAHIVDQAGADMILIGDSLGMVMLGMDDTVSVTMDEMILHCRSVSRGAKAAYLVGDMPFMSYALSAEQAVENAGRIMKEGRVNAVKLEGGAEIADKIKAITQAGISVVGHIGLTPQTISQIGGYRIQAKTAATAFELYENALALQEAGCVAVVIELVPAAVGKLISERLTIPTIGIGSGAGCDGQVMVYHDMLGLVDVVTPRFVKRYAEIGAQITEAVQTYCQEVADRTFPSAEHIYPIADEELAQFEQMLAEQ